jgi:hypothetical protein
MTMRRSKKYAVLAVMLVLFAAGAGLLRSRVAVGTTSPNLAVSFNPPKGFIEQFPLPGSRSWKMDDATIVLFESKFDGLEEPTADEEKFKKEFYDGQKLIHALAGISEYKLEKVERVKVSDGLKIVLTGTYLDSQKEKIRFEKWQYYLKAGFAQIDYAANDNQRFPARAEIEKILKGYTPWGI